MQARRTAFTIPYSPFPIPRSLKRHDFHFDLPPELIAQAPLAQRSGSRLLLADAASRRIEDRRFTELPELLRAGDLLVFNDTRVLPARLFGRKASGGAVEILIERVTGTHEALAQLGVSKKPKAGGRIVLSVRPGSAERGAELAIADSGPGIPAAARAKVLERFVRQLLN